MAESNPAEENPKEKKHFSIKESDEVLKQKSSEAGTKSSEEMAKSHSSLSSALATSSKDEVNVSKKVKPPQLEARFRDDSFEVPKKELKYVDKNEEKSVEEAPSSLSVPDEQEKKLRFGEQKDSRTKGMRFEYGRCPKTCERFLGIVEFSKIFVDEIIEDALLKGRGFKQQSSVRIIEGIEYNESSDESLSLASIGTYVCVLEWPTIEEFTQEIGTAKISEYLSYWKFEEDWKYCINFLIGKSDSACDFYQYEAIFSIPCKQYPIAQATASVFFVFEVSRIKPRHCLVDVHYWFEGQRTIHTPGKFTFQEEKLFNIVDAKINFYKTLRF
ncbi:uncharacterized protein LOC103313598 isoform X3 [Tribolium castaneum]|uniref:Uncharacterized protein n=1 Tax=Tribolium castaneum TaxID=7070 RepID=A0A139WFP9_TRICA|nr:PREDICTED: uncharacterized protein LOC103313616 [Tribolium castaneum]KYB26744.1 hypothetical protein TcasGA2_TC033652 [Tribolium castaneum]|eukprot:XP_008195550.1 PREDICTED: uncharacterized protein LOC103313616 [Tribolium castaneum]